MAETIEQIPEWMPEELKEIILRHLIAKNVRERLVLGWGKILHAIQFLRGHIEADWENLEWGDDEWRRGGNAFVCEYCEMDEIECECDGWRSCWACGRTFDECDC